MSTRIKCCIIGIPDHQGVFHVGGRLGAAGGPSAFRKVFSRLRGRLLLSDLGDVGGLGSDVATNHMRASEQIWNWHKNGGVSVVVGGGHDHGYSQLVGVVGAQHRTGSKKKIKLGCINIDAHLDVRKPEPVITSGSAFYLALESGVLSPTRFVEFGIQSHCNPPELWKYVEKKGLKVVPFATLRNGKASGVFKKVLKTLVKSCDQIVVSLDLDSAASAFAPGVSAPQAEGFTPSEILEMVEIAGNEKKVRSLGIFELNPEHDLADQTARLAATAAFHFIEAKTFRNR